MPWILWSGLGDNTIYRKNTCKEHFYRVRGNLQLEHREPLRGPAGPKPRRCENREPLRGPTVTDCWPSFFMGLTIGRKHMPSRKIEDCVPELQGKYQAFKAAMDAAGIPFMITCTARNVKEQIALYSQGRQPLEQVNSLRRSAGLSPISFMENVHKVTWTLHSKHIIDLDDGDLQVEFKCPGSCGQVWVTTQYIEKILAKSIFIE